MQSSCAGLGFALWQASRHCFLPGRGGAPPSVHDVLCLLAVVCHAVPVPMPLPVLLWAFLQVLFTHSFMFSTQV